jgi:hypothetical protein
MQYKIAFLRKLFVPTVIGMQRDIYNKWSLEKTSDNLAVFRTNELVNTFYLKHSQTLK